MIRPLFYLICDESGAKGYSDHPAQGIDSLGLVAGLIVHESQLSDLQRVCTKIRNKYYTDRSSKFHMTDLKNEEQDSLRNEIFNAIICLNARMVYSSITKEGMHAWYNIQKKLRDDIVKKEKERGYGISFQSPKESMLEMLYYDMISRFFAAIIDHCVPDGNFDAKILTDNLDASIIDGIINTTSEFITYNSHSKNDIKTSRFNYKTKLVEKASGKIGMNVEIPESLNADELNNIAFEIQIDDSLSIFPDVVANSLLYFAKNNLQSNNELAMNSAELIAGHQLERYFVSLSAADNFDFMRALYCRNDSSKVS